MFCPGEEMMKRRQHPPGRLGCEDEDCIMWELYGVVAPRDHEVLGGRGDEEAKGTIPGQLHCQRPARQPCLQQQNRKRLRTAI